MMALTRSFKDFIKRRIETDAAFRQALFQEAVQTLIEGDIDTAKAVLRDYINATIGFPALAAATGTPPKSLMRMFGPKGNPAGSPSPRRHRGAANGERHPFGGSCGRECRVNLTGTEMRTDDPLPYPLSCRLEHRTQKALGRDCH